MIRNYPPNECGCAAHEAKQNAPVTTPCPNLRLALHCRASSNTERLLTVIEQRPELRKALQVRPVAAKTAVDSSWDIRQTDVHDHKLSHAKRYAAAYSGSHQMSAAD